MCWLTTLPIGFDLTEQQFKNARRTNDDGTGFAYAKDGQLFVEKGFMDFESFYEAYTKVGIDCPRVVHHRLGWGGGRNAENCHPFIVNDGLCFAHNGILSTHTAKGGQSDTNLFNEEVLKPLFGDDIESIQKPYIKFLISQAIGSSNKFVFLDKNGVCTIINPQSGEWDKSKNGAWYSSNAHTWEPYVHGGNSSYKNGVYQPPQNNFSAKDANATSSVKNNKNETYTEWLQRHYDEYVEAQKKTSQSPKKETLLLTQ